MSPEYIKDILTRIRTEYNIDDLSKYRKFFKKHVPFFMRSWVAAALMMELDREGIAGRRQGAPARGERNSSRKGPDKARVERPVEKQGRDTRPGDSKAASREKQGRISPEREQQREPTVRVLIPEDEGVTLFFSAGRKRRVFPRDIVGFLIKETGSDRNDIGDIRVLDNFSFVQVRKECAENLIQALEGKSFRGRSLTVSYAKPRSESSNEDRDGQDNFEAADEYEEAGAIAESDAVGESDAFGESDREEQDL